MASGSDGVSFTINVVHSFEIPSFWRSEALQILRRLDARTMNINEALDALTATETAESTKLDAYITATADLLAALRGRVLPADVQAKVDALSAAIAADSDKIDAAAAAENPPPTP